MVVLPALSQEHLLPAKPSPLLAARVAFIQGVDLVCSTWLLCGFVDAIAQSQKLSVVRVVLWRSAQCSRVWHNGSQRALVKSWLP